MDTTTTFRQHLELAKTSGLSFSEYAKQNNINVQSLYSLNSKIKSRAARKPTPEFKRIAIERMKSSKIYLPTGIAIEVDEGNIDFAVAVASKLLHA